MIIEQVTDTECNLALMLCNETVFERVRTAHVLRAAVHRLAASAPRTRRAGRTGGLREWLRVVEVPAVSLDSPLTVDLAPRNQSPVQKHNVISH